MAISGIVIGSAGLIFGQVSPAIHENAPGWINVLGGLTSLTFAVWYAWYVTTKTIPQRDEVHAETIKNLIQEFRNEAKEQRLLHTAAVEKIDVSMDRLSNAIERAIAK